MSNPVLSGYEIRDEKVSFLRYVENSIVRFLATVIVRRAPFLADVAVLRELKRHGELSHPVWSQSTVIGSLVNFVSEERYDDFSVPLDGECIGIFDLLIDLLRHGDSMSALRLICAAISKIMDVEISLRCKAGVVAVTFETRCAGKFAVNRWIAIKYLTVLIRASVGRDAIVSASTDRFKETKKLSKLIDASKLFIANSAEICVLETAFQTRNRARLPLSV